VPVTSTRTIVKRTVALISGPDSAAEKVFNDFLASLDLRGDSKDSQVAHIALACSSGPRFREFLERSEQPCYRRCHLAAIAQSCDISLDEFREFWQRAGHGRARNRDRVLRVAAPCRGYGR
jgi:hypothetical protein